MSTDGVIISNIRGTFLPFFLSISFSLAFFLVLSFYFFPCLFLFFNFYFFHSISFCFHFFIYLFPFSISFYLFPFNFLSFHFFLVFHLFFFLPIFFFLPFFLLSFLHYSFLSHFFDSFIHLFSLHFNYFPPSTFLPPTSLKKPSWHVVGNEAVTEFPGRLRYKVLCISDGDG